MARAAIIDGKAIAAALRREVAAGAAALVQATGTTPGLAVVLVGEDPASQVYVRSKGAATREAGMASFEHKLAADVSETALLDVIEELNRRPDVHGILVQLPLPKHIDAAKVIEAIDPAKDVDGFHPVNVGRLATGGRAFAPCTPTGCLILAKSVQPRLEGLEAVVIGRSNIVGKPMAQLLLAENCTAPTWWWRPSAGRRWCVAAGSSPAPSSSTSGSSVWRPPTARAGS
jgi:methylenetetrahydrofolate dehydrogenase (NADP+)/methenyltetrahydrofolate cyclohydrolase